MAIYYIAGYPVSDELYHYGVKGQSWGKRRFQNPDGSLTMLGRQHYDVGAPLGTNPQQMSVSSRSRAQAQLSGPQAQAQLQAQRQRIQSSAEVTDRSTVSRAQQNLQNLGYGLKKYGADGKIGDETRSAINAFKRDHGLREDGRLDLATSKMMEAESKSSLKNGAKGENVTRMQDTLQTLGYKLGKYGSDGKFGQETQKALNAFKKEHGLPENGIYDSLTRIAMAKELDSRNADAQKESTANQALVAQPRQESSPVPETTTEQTNQVPETTTESTDPVHEVETEKSASDREEIQPEQKESSISIPPKTKSDISRTERAGQKKTEQILNAIQEYGDQIADQHGRLTEALSKANEKTGAALGSAAKSASSAISSTAKALERTLKKREKAYADIMEASRNVSASSLRIEKDIKKASEQLVRQHNKIMSEVSGLSKEARKTMNKIAKQNKKTGKSITSFFNKASSKLDRGSRAISRMFGL